MKDNYKEADVILHHQELFVILEAIQIELISRYYNDFLVSHFDINKTKELIRQKY